MTNAFEQNLRTARILGMDDASGRNGKKLALKGRTSANILKHVKENALFGFARENKTDILEAYDMSVSETHRNMVNRLEDEQNRIAELTAKIEEFSAHDVSTFVTIRAMHEKTVAHILSLLPVSAQYNGGLISRAEYDAHNAKEEAEYDAKFLAQLEAKYATGKLNEFAIEIMHDMQAQASKGSN